MRFQAALVGAFLAAGGALAQQHQATVGASSAKRPMTFADLMAMKRVSDPQISPSGKWVMFSVTEVSLEKNSKVNHLWVVPLEPGNREQGAGDSERQVTVGSGESNGRFSPDGKWVMYTSSEGGSSQIWIAPWEEKAGKVGAGHAVTALETEADGAIWAPDSRHILFTSAVWPECESKAPMGTRRNEEEANCNAVKDAAASAELARRLQDIEQRRAALAVRDIDTAVLDDYRWLLEEYRVSLFAQTLGTAVPVSATRLDRLWADIPT